MKEKLKILKQKWSLAIKIIPLLIVIIILKLIFHKFGWEVITLNALFTSILAGTIFLLGFLISGVLSDYKEAEKIPGELACSLEVIYDETYIIEQNKKSKTAKDFLKYQKEFVESLNKWFFKNEKTYIIYNKLSNMNDYFAKLESEAQAGFIARMKQEQSNIRKIITRVHTIKETDFIATAYAIAESLIFFMIAGMILVKIEPFYESLFFVILVSFLTLYMIFLIRDLDNPFDYEHHGEFGTEVSLKPFHDFERRLNEKL